MNDIPLSLRLDVAKLTRLAITLRSPDAVRAVVKASGHTNPVGGGDAKVGTTATYNKVGETCPPTCAQFPQPGKKRTCMALSGNVALHEKRALPLWQSNTRAAIIAMVQAGAWRNPARLHVSGDFYANGVLDTQYLEALIEAATIIRDHYSMPIVAWAYTHVTRAEFSPWWDRMKEAGIVVRYSGDRGRWGVVVTTDPDPWKRARELNATYCPEQAAKARGVKLSCVTDCGLCYDRDRLVLFSTSNNTKPEPDEGV